MKKNKCPIDADEGKDDCPERYNNWYACTRPKGHKGKHHAHATGKSCVKIW